MATDNRNYQLQGSYTRYYDGLRCGFGSASGPGKCRNYKTLESAIRAARKELKENELPKVVKAEKEDYTDELGRKQVNFRFFAEDGHEFAFREDYSVWHVDGMRIVDRETQKVLWES